MTAAVLADYRTASISAKLRATLAFLEKMTLAPDALERDDADAARAAGVTDAELRDAAHVCAAFNVIVRIADALEFDIPSDAIFHADAKMLLKRGYG